MAWRQCLGWWSLLSSPSIGIYDVVGQFMTSSYGAKMTSKTVEMTSHTVRMMSQIFMEFTCFVGHFFASSSAVWSPSSRFLRPPSPPQMSVAQYGSGMYGSIEVQCRWQQMTQQVVKECSFGNISSICTISCSLCRTLCNSWQCKGQEMISHISTHPCPHVSDTILNKERP